MDIRILNQEELLPALHLAWEVYAQDVIPTSTPESIRAFQDYIRYENISMSVRNKKLTIFGAFENAELCGTIAISADGQLTLFFVKKEWQGKGIGRMLFQASYNYCVQQAGVRQITVKAAPEAVERYRHLGMQVAGGEIEEYGRRYVPMETFAIPGLVQPVKKHGKAPVIIGIIVGVLLIGGLIFAGFSIVNGIREMIQSSITEEDDSYDEDHDFYDDYDDNNGSYDYSTGEETGIDAIEAYIADDISYEINEENYNYSGDPDASTYIDFYVNYPSVSGLSDASVEKEVNELLESCAMQTVNEIYNNPSQEIKERVLNASVPTLVSYVNCKVCYAEEEFISVAFEDYCYKGSQEYFEVHLRTLNINLKEGTVYQVKDIVKLDENFLNRWLDEMQAEAESTEFLNELGQEDLKAILEGDSQDGVYIVNFFVSADKIEIGFDLNYPDDSPYDQGYAWVTAPLEIKDLKQYATDSNFWNLLEK